MNTETLLDSSATTLARVIRDREVSSEEVVFAYLKRIETLNPVLNSVIQIAPESALEHARAADEALARGQLLGPLHGVPFTVKDVYAVRDSARLVTAPGMVERPDPPPERDSTVVLRLRAAGAILIAVTKATLWHDREERYGYTRNPYDLARTPGGSSGGEAATIAAGGSPLGMGSDSGGSLRQPAHYCGVATLRPSNGRVPRGTDAEGTNDPRTAAGPLARSVEDLALALRVISGFDWEDPTSLPVPLGDDRDVLLEGLRVAVHTDNGIVPPTAETAAAVVAAARALEEAGAIVEEAAPPDLDAAWEITRDYWGYGRKVGTVAEYFRFLERWDRYRVTLLSFMRSRDLLLCPVEAFPAPVQDAKDPGYRRLPPRFTYTTPFSLVGWPCAVVRAGASPEGLPIGVQVVGGPWRDDVALAAARQIEAAQGGWKRPAL
jgi:amidase